MKFINAQDKQTKERLINALNKLPEGDIVSITGSSNMYRLRIGSFRALFERENDIIKVTLLDNRGQIYKRGGKA
jgi:mRNA interferase RelE/StbE